MNNKDHLDGQLTYCVLTLFSLTEQLSGAATVDPGTIYLGLAPTPTLREGKTFSHFHISNLSTGFTTKEPNDMWEEGKVPVLWLLWSRWRARLCQTK